jgi:hypothetical protein
MKTATQLRNLAAVISPQFGTAECVFTTDGTTLGTGRKFTYLAPLFLLHQLAKGDVVLVSKSAGALGYATVMVASISFEADLPDDRIEYEWIVQRVVTQQAAENRSTLAALGERLAQAQRRSVKIAALSALNLSETDTKALLEGPSAGNSHAAPSGMRWPEPSSAVLDDEDAMPEPLTGGAPLRRPGDFGLGNIPC